MGMSSSDIGTKYVVPAIGSVVCKWVCGRVGGLQLGACGLMGSGGLIVWDQLLTGAPSHPCTAVAMFLASAPAVLRVRKSRDLGVSAGCKAMLSLPAVRWYVRDRAVT